MANAEQIVEKESGGPSAFAWKRQDEYRGGAFMSHAEAVEHAEAGTVFYVTEVGEPEPGYKGAVKRIVTLSRDADTDVQKSFDIMNVDGKDVFAGRALMLADFAEHLAAEGDAIAVRFIEAGTGVTFEPALAEDE